MRISVLLSFFIICLLGCESTETTVIENVDKPKNIILLIGDGMGLTQISSSYYFQKSTPNFSRFKNIGLSNTSASNSKITDSAAGATAFSAGVKTYNGAIGVDSKKQSVPTIVELTSEMGWNTGVIATSTITHATPASFYAHVESRNMQNKIAEQLASSEIDFFAGGGLQHFYGRADSVDVIASLKAEGFIVDTTALTMDTDPESKYGFLLAKDGMPRMLDGRGEFLVESSKLSLDYFDKKGGAFFLMIEGSQIDWGGHANDADYLISELLDFDKVIGLALDYAEQDGNTLVVVTADHETGGFTLASNDNDYNDIKGTFSTGGHSTTLIPVFAYGPGSERFQGVYENNEIFHKMMEAISKE